MAQFLPQASQHSYRGVGPFEDGLGLGAALLAAAFSGGELWENPPPDVEVARNLCPGGIADSKLGNFDQPRLNGVGEAEIAHNPGKDTISLLPDTSEEIRCGGEIDTHVDATELMNAVEAIDPDRSLFKEFLAFLCLPEEVLFAFLGLGFSDPVGVVCLVVKDEDILLASDLPAEDAVL